MALAKKVCFKRNAAKLLARMGNQRNVEIGDHCQSGCCIQATALYIGKVCIIAVGNMANAVRPADSEHPVFSRCVRGKPI